MICKQTVQLFILYFFFSSCTEIYWQFSWERAGNEIKSIAPKLFLSPQQDFCSWNSTAWSLAQGEITALCMLSAICTLLCRWFSHPQNGSIIQSQTPIHINLTQLTQPDTWLEDWMIWEQFPLSQNRSNCISFQPSPKITSPFFYCFTLALPQSLQSLSATAYAVNVMLTQL